MNEYSKNLLLLVLTALVVGLMDVFKRERKKKMANNDIQEVVEMMRGKINNTNKSDLKRELEDLDSLINGAIENILEAKISATCVDLGQATELLHQILRNID